MNQKKAKALRKLLREITKDVQQIIPETSYKGDGQTPRMSSYKRTIRLSGECFRGIYQNAKKQQ